MYVKFICSFACGKYRMAEAGGGNGGHGGHGGHHGALHWTTNMSSLMLRRMVELIAKMLGPKGFQGSSP